jgi:hypothetical protein
MADETQQTPQDEERDVLNLPGEGGYTIPVPKRGDVMAALRKVAKPRQSSSGDDPDGPSEPD